jgi:type I restriction enzyme S subunit
VDETIEYTEALIEKYRNIKKGLMVDLLTRGVDEEGRVRREETHRFKNSQLGRIPEEWEVVKLDDYAENITSGGTPSREIKRYFDGNIRWLKTAELRDKEIYESEEKITELGLQESSAKIFPINTVLIAMYGATIGKLGVLKEDCATNQACCAFICYKNSYKYLFYYLLNSREKLISLGAGAGQPNISQNILKSFPILLPPLSEQVQIAEILTVVDDRLQKEEVYREKLLQIKKGLMQDLLTGRVRVKVPQEAVA